MSPLVTPAKRCSGPHRRRRRSGRPPLTEKPRKVPPLCVARCTYAKSCVVWPCATRVHSRADRPRLIREAVSFSSQPSTGSNVAEACQNCQNGQNSLLSAIETALAIWPFWHAFRADIFLVRLTGPQPTSSAASDSSRSSLGPVRLNSAGASSPGGSRPPAGVLHKPAASPWGRAEHRGSFDGSLWR
jgi:hypothetical protein